MKVIKCLECGAFLNVPAEILGQQVRCPECPAVLVAPQDVQPSPSATQDAGSPLQSFMLGTAFTPPATEIQRPGEPIGSLAADLDSREVRRWPSPDFDEDDRAPWRRHDLDEDDRAAPPWQRRDFDPSSRHSWRTVQSGLNTIFVGLMCLACAIFLSYLLLLITETTKRPGVLFDGIVLLLFSGCFFAIAGTCSLVACFVGLCLCLTAPRSRGWVWGSFGSLGASFVLLGTFLVFLQAPKGPVREALLMLFGLCSIANLACFSCFLREVAQRFDNPPLARNCVFLLLFHLLGSSVVIFHSQAQEFATAVGELIRAVTHVNTELAMISIPALGLLAYLFWFGVTVRKVRNTIHENVSRLHPYD